HHPGTFAALRRLVRDGWVSYQGPVVVDTRTGELAAEQSRRVARYRTTAKGRRLLEAVNEDLRVAEATFPQTTPANLNSVLRLLAALDLDGTHARWGLSGPHASEIAGFAERTGRWWIRRLCDAGYLRRLPVDIADVR